MLHHGGKRHAVGSRQFCNRGLPPAKSRQDGATGGIGKRRKCRIEPLTIVNHRVKYSGSQSLVKLAVFLAPTAADPFDAIAVPWSAVSDQLALHRYV
jgi:hypothetical protein